MDPIAITDRLPTPRETLNRCCWWGHQVSDTHWLPAGEVRLPSRVAPVTARYACVPVADDLVSESGGNEPV